MACFDKLEEADVLALIANNAPSAGSVIDVNDVTGGGAGETVTVQAYLNALSEDDLELGRASGFTALGASTISVTAPSGFTTADIVGKVFVKGASTRELALSDVVSDTGSVITYELSGTEDVHAGHELKVAFLKLKV